MPDQNAEVLIAGAGPVGCTAALALARAGVSVILAEGGGTLPLELRASTFHPPTLDLLDELDLTRRLIPLGLITRDYQYRDRATGEAAVFDLGILANDTGHPYRLQCEQYKLTQVVCEMLDDYPNAKVLFGREVIGARQDGDGVRMLCFTGEKEELYTGRYLIGADGANSTVRKSLTMRYVGFTYPEKFLVLSTPFDFAAHMENLSNVNYVADSEEWCVLLRTTDLWRVLLPTVPGEPDEKFLAPEYAQQRLNALVPRDEPYEVAHRTLYWVHQRVAETYRVGNIALAGDAAHINNPLGGMGMNGGIQDAIVLAEKLIAILQEGASEDMLDLYDQQRRSIATEFIQKQTIRNKKRMEALDPDSQRKRQAEFMRTAADPERAHAFLLQTSMIQAWRDSQALGHT
ncbi:MAG: NAD(P)/FAD-dependent oxidoreductase [Gammaproteobacteria bacterium]|nr:NAD(P)/FAD-dependent oxidoreductase [Gammaproteobacteria bacterium]MCY4166628.1 NAD(P)/FAD-dependent oxidoreductase [Gammaproteobacteria bacterium]